MTDMDYYWKMLKDEKIIVDAAGTGFTLHPSFGTVLENYLMMYPKDMMLGLMNAAKSYCPTSSVLQRSIICNFVTVMIKESSPQLFKQLEEELKIEKIKYPHEKSPLMPTDFGNAIEMLKDEVERK